MTTSASNPFALCADKMRTPCTSRSGFPTGTPFLLQADRKSTRLNSSHSQISYAVFCLKKKKKLHIIPYAIQEDPVTYPVVDHRIVTSLVRTQHPTRFSSLTRSACTPYHRQTHAYLALT